jgi:hypothetical protein
MVDIHTDESTWITKPASENPKAKELPDLDELIFDDVPAELIVSLIFRGISLCPPVGHMGFLA